MDSNRAASDSFDSAILIHGVSGVGNAPPEVDCNAWFSHGSPGLGSALVELKSIVQRLSDVHVNLHSALDKPNSAMDRLDDFRQKSIDRRLNDVQVNLHSNLDKANSVMCRLYEFRLLQIEERRELIQERNYLQSQLQRARRDYQDELQKMRAQNAWYRQRIDELEAWIDRMPTVRHYCPRKK